MDIIINKLPSLLLLFFIYGLSSVYQRNCVYIDRREGKKFGWISNGIFGNLILLSIILILSFYAANTEGMYSNDRSSYYFSFIQGDNSIGFPNSFNAIIDSHFGFQQYQNILRSIIGKNGYLYFFITAFIINTSNILFFKKYAKDFKLLLFLYIASTYYLFSLNALKQALAIAIAIWAVPFLSKKKLLRGLGIVLIAASFHKMILFFLLAMLLKGKVASIKTVLLILATSFSVVGFDLVFTTVSEITGYSTEYLVYFQGVSVFRVAIWIIPLILSIIYKNSINEHEDEIGLLFLNMATVGGLIMFAGLFGGANLIGRAAYYFYPFLLLAFGEVFYVLDRVKSQNRLRAMCYIGFFTFYLFL